jgi:PTH1 family peptidyl-tRNA hydrolase
MNRSGPSIQKFAAYYKVQLTNIVIVHDDMDLGFGQIKIVKSRGHGGHNGVRSIIESFGNKDFIRVRVGVGHPGDSDRVTGHVLGGFTPDESRVLPQLIEQASDACFYILENGISAAMNTFNTKL